MPKITAKTAISLGAKAVAFTLGICHGGGEYGDEGPQDMSQLTEVGQRIVADLAQRYGLSQNAVEQMAQAVSNGGGTMAQFNIPELGGGGQWMAGGMTMVGDMFNHGLKAQVENLCGELSNAMAQSQLFQKPQTIAGAAWWPEELGQPSSVGGQNNVRYAYFPQQQKIAFDPGAGTAIILLDTQDHQIGGWSQQQSGPGDPYQGISFSSQYGQFPLSSLSRVSAVAEEAPATAQVHPLPVQETAPEKVPEPEAAPIPEKKAVSEPATTPPPEVEKHGTTDEIFSTIERLGKLRDAGLLTEDEFSAKKTELLARL